MRRIAWWAITAGLTLLSSTAMAQLTVTGTGSHLWDIQSDGSIFDGSADAYDNMYRLRVGGATFTPTTVGATYASGRGWATGTQSLSGLTVSRRVYVPVANTWWGETTNPAGFARFEDILTNPTAASITVEVEVFGNLGSDVETFYVGTSDGDLAMEASDEWVATDDADAGGDRSLAHVLQGGGAPSAASALNVSVDELTWRFSVTIPAGGTRRLVYFGVQAINRASAENMAEKLRTWTIPDQWENIAGSELAQVVNWQMSTSFTTSLSVGGFTFDPRLESGALDNGGSADAYDDMYTVSVNGAAYAAPSGTPILRLEGGRLLVMAPVLIGTQRVQRMWHVPSEGAGVARGSVIIHNSTLGGAVNNVTIAGNLGSDFATQVVSTSSGDTAVTGADSWVVTDDADGADDPSLGHVFGSGVASASISTDSLTWTYTGFDVPAGDARIWTFFAIQAPNRAAARSLVDATARTGSDFPLSTGPFPPVQNSVAWAPAWSARSVTFPFTVAHMTSGDGFLYDVALASGALTNGLTDAYDTMYLLDVGPTTVRYADSFAVTRSSDSGQSLDLRGRTVGGLFVRRRYFVPSSGASFVRFYNVFGNPSASPVSRDIRMYGDLGSDTATVVTGSSSGDTTFTTADSWFGTDDADAAVDPSLSHVVRRSGTVVEPIDVASVSADNVSWTYQGVSVPARSEIALMMFGVQAANRATANARADSLDDLALASATTGLSAAEVAAALNFFALLPNGAACTPSSSCASGHCVDGVCCATACAGGPGDCQACSIAAGGTTDGTCTLANSTYRCRLGTRCDPEEFCTGSSPECPPDVRLPAGARCADELELGPCMTPYVCSETGLCSSGLAPAGTVCRPATSPCDAAETCTGETLNCPDDVLAADGTSCSDGTTCNGAELCVTGTCVAGPTLDCDDGDVCTADACAEPGGCMNTPIADCCSDDAACDDGDPCTDDVCDVDNTCVNDRIPGCTGVDAGMMRPDAGMPRDAGRGDADVTTDAGTTRPPTSGGCGCSVPSGSSRLPLALVIGLGLVGLVVRRRLR
jgi:hypothetical protein